MPPPPSSAKRSQRIRREAVNNADVLDSSPSRPAKRRKKVEEPLEPPAAPAALPYSQEGIDMTDDEIVNAVTPYMTTGKDPVQAARDHSNKQYKKANVQAFAKLAGKDWTFYVSSLSILIGRPPEGGAVSPQGATIDVDLGPSKHISRQHAKIEYDQELLEWYIDVVGRNPIRIDNEKYPRSSRRKLCNGQVIEIGGIEMMFALPSENAKLEIDPMYLVRAGLIQPREAEDQDGPAGSSTSTAPDSSSQPARHSLNGAQGGVPLAPAPPDYRRPGTPVSARSRGQLSLGKSPGYLGNTIILNADDVDLTLDENSHIKPSYSYAQLITQAILDTEEEKVTLNGIYSYIMEKFSYYRHQVASGWQNSIRHNLSLNKAFKKIPRESNEPGKGMKWQIVEEHRDDMVKNSYKGGRGGHRGSPGTPTNLSVTRGRPGAGRTADRVPRSPRSGSPGLRSNTMNSSHFTPDQEGRRPGSLQDIPGDGSPLPRHRRQLGGPLGLSDNALGSPPALSSSYMQEEGSSFITPAPHRVHPTFAPPSTAQRPSQHMPTSSPAPFWKYAEYGVTPMKGGYLESSPVKPSDTIPPSSSPAPARRTLAASPTRNGAGSKATAVKDEPATVPTIEEADEEEEEEPAYDLMSGFPKISDFHRPPTMKIPELPAHGLNGTNGANVRV